MRKIEASEVKRILCIKLRGIGDVLLSSVVFDTLRRSFPAAEIDYLTEYPGSQVLEELDYISEIILFNQKEGSSPALLRQIRRRKYDLVLDFYSNPRTALITFLSGASRRAGFPYRGRKYAYNLYGPPERDKYHAAELHLEFMRSIGIETEPSGLQLGLAAEDIAFASKIVKNSFPVGKTVIGISPSGGWQSKKCDPSVFAGIADKAAEVFAAEIMILWGPGDEHEAQEIKRLMRKPAVEAPPTTIRQLAALIKQCSLVIANDSGPMHMASAVGTPVVGLFGPTNPEFQGPYGEHCSWVQLTDLQCIRCNELICPKNHECFRDLPFDMVIEECKTVLHRQKRN